MTRHWGKFGMMVTAAALLAACTAVHQPEPYLPAKSGIVPGETITVKQNQNVYGIAQEHGVSMRDIIVLNGLQEPFALKPGQSLVLPYKRGDKTPDMSLPMSADGVAAAPLGGVQTESLSPIQSQELPPPPFQKGISQAAVTTPTPIPAANSAAPPSTIEALNAPSAVAQKEVATTLAPVAPAAATAPAPAASAPVELSANAPSMVWPVQGPVLSGFGPKGQGVNNDGVNIGAPKGAPVVASAAGNVVYAGDDMKGFGNLILIRHEGGWVTAYAHLDRVLVAKDSVVAQGDMIGTVGKTGNITSPQLHFEVRHNGKVVDPKGLIK